MLTNCCGFVGLARAFVMDLQWKTRPEIEKIIFHCVFMFYKLFTLVKFIFWFLETWQNVNLSSCHLFVPEIGKNGKNQCEDCFSGETIKNIFD